MSHKKNRTFQNMSYRKVQRKNSRNRNLLNKENQNWLKANGYRNMGWDNVINLSQKITELQRQEQIHNLDLEELFLEADRIGNKYFSDREIHDKQQAIAKELNEIAEIIDTQFTEDRIEVIDYSKKSKKQPRKRTTKIR